MVKWVDQGPTRPATVYLVVRDGDGDAESIMVQECNCARIDIINSHAKMVRGRECTVDFDDIVTKAEAETLNKITGITFFTFTEGDKVYHENEESKILRKTRRKRRQRWMTGGTL